MSSSGDDILLAAHVRVTSKLPEREVRVAVSMVGGVSLAIYENGVAQELFRMTHGRGLYGVLKRITHSHAYIDILSGTSAGGMNTIFLSTALCADTNLWPTHDDWVRLGGVEALMHPVHKKDILSLFNGNDYYYPELQKVFERLLDQQRNTYQLPAKEAWNDGQGIPSGRDAATGRYGNLDLFVTGTYFRPQPLIFFDARTQPIYNNDYMAVFSFKHRPRRGATGESHFDPRAQEPKFADSPKNGPFDKSNRTRPQIMRDRLARVARTTSSLPAVFETSLVEAELMNGIIELPGKVPSTFMGDGGYLNNRPLNLVLETIPKRSGNREVVRKIFFVEPVATEGENAGEELTEPRAAQHGLHAMMVSRNQNLQRSLNELYEHNQKVRYIGEALDAARIKAGETPHMSSIERDLWVKLRLQELRDAVIEQWEEALKLSALQGVQKGGIQSDETSQTVPEKARRGAAVLKEMRGRLLTLLEKHCADLNSEGRRPGATFQIAQIDSFYLRRAALRAVQELYDALFNNRQALDPDDPSYAAVQAHLSECYHVEVLARLIETHVGMVLRTLAASPEYNAIVEALAPADSQKAPPQASRDNARRRKARLATNLAELWWLCVGSLHMLLDETLPIPVSPIKDNLTFDALKPLPKIAGGAVETAPERNRRHQENQEMLRDKLEKRSQWICSILQHGANAKLAKVNAAERQNLKSYAQRNPNTLTILQRLEKHLHYLVLDGAIEWQLLQEKTKAKVASETPTPYLIKTTEQENRALLWLEEFALDALADFRNPTQEDIAQAAIKERLGILDSCLFPLERAAGLVCPNNLELVQISARDVQIGLSRREASQKLGGDMLGNLSGFLKASWRVNDLMWGRLDGSGAIVESLLDYQRLTAILEKDPHAVQEIIQAIEDYIESGTVLRPDSEVPAPDTIGHHLLQPHNEIYPQRQWKADFAQIKTWLRGGWENDSLLPEESNGFTLLRDWLLRRHQLEILCEEVPEVLTHAVAEQAQWRGTGAAAPSLALEEMLETSPAPPAFAPPALTSPAPPAPIPIPSTAPSQNVTLLAHLFGTHPDATASALLTQRARDWAWERFGRTANQRVNPACVEKFFAADYKVGGETMENLPPVVMLRRLLAFATLGLRAGENSLSHEFKASGPGTLISRVLRWPAQLANLFYGVLVAVSQGKSIVTALMVFGCTLASIAALALFFKRGAEGTSPLLWATLLLSLALVYILRWAQRQAAFPSEESNTKGNALALGATLLIGVVFSYFIAPKVSSLFTFSLHFEDWKKLGLFLWAGTSLLMLAMTLIGQKLRTSAAPHGIISLEFAGTRQRFLQIFRSWDDWARRAAYASLWLDFPFIVFYTALLFCVNTWAVSIYAHWQNMNLSSNDLIGYLRTYLPPWGYGILILQIAAGVLDGIENFALLKLIKAAQRVSPQVPLSQQLPHKAASLAHFCAKWKFTFALVGILYFLGALYLHFNS